jgi:uncharacterized Rossmann fold enzyme
MKVNFVMVWTGDRYGPEYPALLRNMVLRNASTMEHPCAWWCVTDRPGELPEGVNAIPADPAFPGYWQKVRLFSPDMPWAEGDRCVYFDLDVCITGRLEDLVEREGIAPDPGWPCFNSSVMVWNHGEHRDAWDRFTPDVITRAPGPIVPANVLPAGAPNGGDQEWLTEVGGWQTLPRDWVVSWRWQAQTWPPSGAKVVQFHGATKPHAVKGGWVPNVWKLNGYTSLPEMKGVNTTEDERLANVRASVKRDLPWFTGFGDEGRSVAIVCGGPSMADSLPDIRAQKRRGARIVSVNNAWRTLVANGVTPHAHVMLDARPQNAEFLKGMPKTTRLLLASQCHPDVFDTAETEGLEVVIWHNGFDAGNEALREILDPWWDEGPNQRPCILVPGGSTVGLRSLWLAAYSGFRTIHLYGMDGSYRGDAHHAYGQPLNDGEPVIEVAHGGKTYLCARWMARQAAEFQETWRDLRNFGEPVTVHVHGEGLIPDIARSLRAQDRVAA